MKDKRVKKNPTNTQSTLRHGFALRSLRQLIPPLIFFISCKELSKPEYSQRHKIVSQIDTLKGIDTAGIVCMIEAQLRHAGLINIKTLDTSIVVDLKYSGINNFIGVDVYGCLDEAFFQKDVAEKLIIAQKKLKEKFPLYDLIIYDAVRPRSIQQLMWDTVKMPVAEKTKYLSNPKYGSLHNYGAAVDISIVDRKNSPLDMGASYDFFGELAYPEKEQQMLREGKLTQQQIDNRKLLRAVMQKAGFFNIQTEWWHFNSCTREFAAQNYKIVE